MWTNSLCVSDKSTKDSLRWFILLECWSVFTQRVLKWWFLEEANKQRSSASPSPSWYSISFYCLVCFWSSLFHIFMNLFVHILLIIYASPSAFHLLSCFKSPSSCYYVPGWCVKEPRLQGEITNRCSQWDRRVKQESDWWEFPLPCSFPFFSSSFLIYLAHMNPPPWWISFSLSQSLHLILRSLPPWHKEFNWPLPNKKSMFRASSFKTLTITHSYGRFYHSFWYGVKLTTKLSLGRVLNSPHAMNVWNMFVGRFCRQF